MGKIASMLFHFTSFSSPAHEGIAFLWEMMYNSDSFVLSTRCRMKRVLIVVFSALLFSPTAVFAQDEPLSPAYQETIDLSLKIKELEKRLFGVDSGTFATKLPRRGVDLGGNSVVVANHITLFLAQDKLWLASGYQGVDVYLQLEGPVDPLELAGRYPDKDVYVGTESAFRSDEDEVSPEFTNISFPTQAIIIAHEGFHAWRSILNDPYSIQEGFAMAYGMYFIGVVFAGESPESRIGPYEMHVISGNMSSYYGSIQHCYNELDALYRSERSREEKLAAREEILASCAARMGEEVNNATLAVQITYAKYFFYALKRIDEYGLGRFVAAYLRMPTDVALGEDAWLKEFDSQLGPR